VKNAAISIFVASRNNRRAASSHGRNSRKAKIGNISKLIVFVMRRAERKLFSGRSDKSHRSNTIMQSNMIHRRDTKLMLANAAALHFKNVAEVCIGVDVQLCGGE